MHFVGTSNQSAAGAPARVLQLAREHGIADCVSEHPARIDYLDALAVQMQASAILLMGSSEHHYTASKLYPALMAGTPILAAYHSLSSVSTILRDRRGSHTRLVEYDDVGRAGAHVGQLTGEIISLMESPPATAASRSTDLGEYAAQALSGRLAAVLERARSS
jgi:hypothetical protein